MFKIYNINDFISKNKCLEVTNLWSFDKDQTATDDGLYSKRIFGLTQKEQSEKYGYISLKQNIVHPRAFILLSEFSSLFPKVILSEKKAVITNGMLVENISGGSGPGWLFENWMKIDWSKYDKGGKNLDKIDYFKKVKRDLIFINKFLVIPVRYRPYKEEHGRIVEDELSGLYKKVLSRAGTQTGDNEFMQKIMQTSSKGSIIQKALNEVEDFLLEELRDKTGRVRGSLVSKKMDNVARLVANARPDVPFNCAAIPWQTLINVFDAYVVSMIYDRTLETNWAKELNVEEYNYTNIADHLTFIYHNADTYTQTNPGLREKWIQLLKEMFEMYPDLTIIGKRDPAWNKQSYFAVKPIIMTDNSYHIVLNSLLYKPLGGDSFNTNFTLKVKDDNTILKDQNGSLFIKDSKQSYQIKSMQKIFSAIKNENDFKF